MQESERDLEAKLLRKLSINDVASSGEAFGIIISALAALSQALDGASLRTIVRNVHFPRAEALASLPSREFESLSALVKARQESLLENEIYKSQMIVQRLISPQKRKRLAAYYTKPVGLELMARLAADFMKTRIHPIILADPFLGSGLTMTATLKHLDTSMVQKIWGVEPHPLPALVAYAAILHFLKGEYKKLEVTVGDVFRNVWANLPKRSTTPGETKDWKTPRADIIAANPPFTRWELLESDYRNILWDLTENLGYSKYVTRRQLNLQVASLFLMDYLLQEDGMLVSVLPASTFYTIYGEAVKRILREKYQVKALVESKSDTSFSVDSGLKEVILLASKQRFRKRNKTAFVTVESNATDEIQQVVEALTASGSDKDGTIRVDLSEKSALPESNWSFFFSNTKLREILTGILSEATKKGTIGEWRTIYGTQSIFRGVEMYGPDFFFLPNRHWRIAQDQTKTLSIENSEDQIRLGIPLEYLVPALRKPGLYTDTIRPEVNHYLLSIPAIPVWELDEGTAQYIAWGRRKLAAQPAIRAFGDHWYSHVNKQIRTKKPFGRVFLPDKVDPTFQNRGLFACHSQTPLVASKNFHIVSLNNDSKDKILALWFNSAIFLSYFILSGRRITKSWSRLLEDNYLRMPIVDLTLLSRRDTKELERVFESILDKRLPPLKQQLNTEFRRQIDNTLLEAIGVDSVEENLKRIYSALEPNLR